MIIYVSNTKTAANSVTIPFEPTEDIAGRIGVLTVEQFFSSPDRDCLQISCSLTQIYAQAFKDSSTQTSTNTCIMLHMRSSESNNNNSHRPHPRYVYVPPGPQNLTFSMTAFNSGTENTSTSQLFGLLVSIKPYASFVPIPATIYASSFQYPFTINYDCPSHLANKTVLMTIESLYQFDWIKAVTITIPDLTQPLSNNKSVVLCQEDSRPYSSLAIPVYLPAGPIPITFTASSFTPYPYVNEAPPFIMSNNGNGVNNWDWWASSSDGSANAYQAFHLLTGSTWTSPATYNATTGNYTGAITTTVTGYQDPVPGEWLQLQVPYKGFLVTGQSFSSTTVNSSLSLGSQNGTTWEPLAYNKSYVYMRVIFLTSKVGNTTVKASKVRFAGSYLFIPHILLSFREIHR